MLPPDLLVVAAAASAAQQYFTVALAAYHAASVNQSPTSILVYEAQRCRAAGAQYAATLTALLDYLDHLAVDASRMAERERTQQVWDTVQRELALLPETP